MAKKVKKTPPRSHGQINLGQSVSSYGIGSICELRSFFQAKAKLNSAMIAGLEWWKPDGLMKISEPTLAKSLGVKRLLQPPIQEEDEGSWNQIPAARFPRWLVCSKCERLGVVGREFSDQTMTQPMCNDSSCGGKGVPSRLVSACFHQPKDGADDTPTGHIDDFPWVWWAFSEQGDNKRCDNPQLYLKSTGKSSSLAGLRVECRCPDCKGEIGRTLEDVFGAAAYTNCTASRPWLNDRDPVDCKRKMRVLLRGASNVYFAVTPSAISIPPYSEALVQKISNDCQSIVESVVDPEFPIKMLVKMVTNHIPYIKDSYSEDQIAHALKVLGDPNAVQLVKSDLEQRLNERVALRQGMPEEPKGKSEFVADPTPPAELANATHLGAKFDHLVRVTRLREVRVLRGFTRVAPPSGGDLYRVACAPISRDRMDWLPAFEVRGEGIYMELNNELVEEWEEEDAVRKRVGLLHLNQQRAREQNSLPPLLEPDLPSSRLILTHTLAHLLMKQLSLECGYSSASLRERLYVVDEFRAREMNSSKSAGFLIYTSTSDADGTLGGLVRQGVPARLEQLLIAAVESARWCSSDPLCIESKGQGADGRNLAACHACCLLSETSCETGNRDLDRGFVIGTMESPELGFFRDILTNN